MSSVVIYLLISRRITFARCQNLFIINLSFADVLVSILAVFRGLGIIDKRFVGAVDGAATPFCAVFSLLLSSFGYSSMVALLPLTIDRAVAVILPLRHGSLINHKTCAVLAGAVWFIITTVLINYLVDFSKGAMTIVYMEKYNKCYIIGKFLYTKNICLFIVPFVLIFLMYGSMLFIIIKSKKSCGRFLLLSAGIIGSNLVFSTPGILIDVDIVKTGYEGTQVFYTTFWYVHGVINPVMYVAIHPKAKQFVKKKLGLA